MGKKWVSAEEFVLAWQAGTSAQSVAQVLGLSTGNTFTRAHRYRLAGVPLKRLPMFDGRGRKPHVDYAALRKLVEETAANG